MGDNTIKNTFRKEKSEKKKSTSKKQFKPLRFNLDRFKGLLSTLKEFVTNEQYRQGFGLGMILISIYFLLAFTSYYFTQVGNNKAWMVDQSNIQKAGSAFAYLFSEYESQNWLGRTGAYLGHFFLYSKFGVVSYLLSFVSFLIGTRLIFNWQLVSIKRAIKLSLIIGVWGSVLFSSLAMDTQFSGDLGGGFGFFLKTKLFSILGKAGTLLLLFVSGIVIAIINFNFNIKSFVQGISNKAIEEEQMEKESEVQNEIKEENIQKEEISIEKTVLPEEPKEELVNDTVTKEVEKDEDDLIHASDAHENVEPLEEVENTISPEKEVVDNQVSFSLDNIPEPPKEDGMNLTLKVEETVEEEEVVENLSEQKVKEFGEYDPTLDLSSYQFPSIELLEGHGEGTKERVDPEELEKNKNNIVNTLLNYKIEISEIKATIGPTVTLYEIIPAPGVRISKIKNLEDDIALSLAALGIRIIAPIPGKGTIGIEVPNSHPDIVSMRSVIKSEKFQNSKMDLPVALGKTISNETFVTDLAKMPHLLMAGATGQGKSVGLNCILTSLLYKKHPSQLKFVLVDPKKVELTLFNKIERHFLAKLPGEEEAIITDTSKVVQTLNSLCVEMDTRYELLKEASCRNLKEYNKKFIQRKLNPEKGHKYLPYIVLVVDEFADLIMTAGKEVETPIARLAQLARAIGIHLIIATQRPSVNIITGTIKANFPARIAFRVTAKIDSRTILDAGGADQLIGRGDMLLSTGSDLIRIQCAFVDTPEVEEICTFIGDQRGYPSAHILPEFVGDNEEGGSFDIAAEDRDALFEEAAKLVVMSQQGSASMLQRKLKLGYNRAGRIVDQLEAAGIIGPFEGSKARKVLIPDELSLEQFLSNGNTDNEF